MTTNVRNIAIIVALAAVVFAATTAENGATAILAVLSTAILVLLVAFVARLYQEHRLEILGLPDNWRAVLYGSLAGLVFAGASAGQLWAAGALGVLVWFAIAVGAVYGLMLVYQYWREYA